MFTHRPRDNGRDVESRPLTARRQRVRGQESARQDMQVLRYRMAKSSGGVVAPSRRQRGGVTTNCKNNQSTRGIMILSKVMWRWEYRTATDWMLRPLCPRHTCRTSKSRACDKRDPKLGRTQKVDWCRWDSKHRGSLGQEGHSYFLLRALPAICGKNTFCGYTLCRWNSLHQYEKSIRRRSFRWLSGIRLGRGNKWALVLSFF